MKYIAYGSNMIKEQMAFRCPDAKLVCVGLLPGYQLEFYQHATVERCDDKHVHVPVAVWEISAEDEQRLDRYEGYPSYYIKKEHTVRMSDGSEIYGMIYLMKHVRTAPPAQSYYKGIADAYHELGLGFEIELVLEPALMRALGREKKL